MIRRLVEKQHIRCGQQQAAQRDPPTLPAGEVLDRRGPRRQTQRICRNLQPPVDLPPARRLDRILEPALLVEKRTHLRVIERLRETRTDPVETIEQALDVIDAFLDVAAHILGVVELRLLRQVPHSNPWLGPRLPVVILIHPRHDAQQG